MGTANKKKGKERKKEKGGKKRGGKDLYFHLSIFFRPEDGERETRERIRVWPSSSPSFFLLYGSPKRLWREEKKKRKKKK